VIYGYAGADPGFLIDFARFFPGAASYDLTVNYRCPTRVVKAAETLLTHNRRRLAKTIAASPGRDEAPTDLVVDTVEDDDLAPAVVRRAQEWMDAGLHGPNAVDGLDATDIAVLARVNSVLLPVQIALVDAGVPCTRAVGPDLLSRTGMTAALAYLRMGLDPQSISRADVLATIRRPSRRIARNVVDMIVKRPNTSVTDLRRLSEWLTGDDADRVAAYADDIEAVAKVVASGTTAQALTVISRDVGLGGAMATLDASKGGERSTHGDDLWALEQVAALHASPATFEGWLREALSSSSRGGVQLSTVHRVKGREWPRVIVFGASVGLFPHRLSEDREEERRVFHVAITRARDRVVVLADASKPSPFIAQLSQPRRAGDSEEAPAEVAAHPRPRAIAAAGAAPKGFEALREWRSDRARQDKVPAYIVLSDAQLRGIAERAPASLVELSRCPGIGPVKLDRYGDEILSVLAAL
ncbi:MAG: 3'-5' exonuclease, partial [Acidimicrobiales bacterium]